MPLQSELVRKELLESNEEFHRLSEEHSQYDKELEALLAKERPTVEDEAEMTRLKKLKLQRKDQMEQMVQAYRREQSEAVQAT
jgi:uncharacterized protein YdcH (DUF465 family)